MDECAELRMEPRRQLDKKSVFIVDPLCQALPYKAKKEVVFTVTCLEKNVSVGRDFFFFSTQTTEMHILAIIMRRQHTFSVYKEKRK